MNIKQIHIINYKNHKNLKLDFEKSVVCLVGLNGVGKTNVLDAIYFSCIGRSYFSSSDRQCVKENESFFRIETEFEHDNLVLTYEKAKRKKIILNDTIYKKLSTYLGLFPVVVIAPDDNILILGGSEERRKFINQTLVQTNSEYLEKLKQYNLILAQRNALLKNSDLRVLDINLLTTYNEKLEPLANFVHQERKKFIQDMIPLFNKAYEAISGSKDFLELEYKSALHDADLLSLLQKSEEKDRILRRTNEGIHKDDLIFYINNNKLKTFGSQGQQKTFLLAVKLAQYYYLENILKKPTIFIIDDIFDKLDMQRSKHLIQYICNNINQVFISHTNKYLLEQNLSNFDFQLIEL